MIAQLVSLIALAAGAAMGLGALISPAWASGVVRLEAAAGRPGGYAEFRATYGGLFFLVHASALAIALSAPAEIGMLVVAPLALGWIGAGLGRVVSLMFDGEKLGGAGLNRTWVATEFGLGLAIGAPLINFL